MRALILLVSTAWALAAVMRLERTPNLVAGYLFTQLFGTLLCEAALQQWGREGWPYTIVYSLTFGLTLFFIAHIARGVLHGNRWAWRIWTAIEGVMFSGFVLLFILKEIFHAYGGIPIEFIPHLAEGCFLLVAGFILSLSMPVLKGDEFKIGTALAALWVAKGIFDYCFSIGTLTQYELWKGLNQWLPAAMFTTAFGWMGYTLTFGRKHEATG